MELQEAIDYYYDHPVEFVEDILKADPDEWQKRVLRSVASNPKVSVRSGQGVGKTALESWVCIWFLVCRPFAKVIATAPTMQQLYDVLWAEIAKWMNDSSVKRILKWTKTKVTMIGDEERWFATAKTATKPENMQGFHEEHMLIIVDEASGVSDPIMEAILGTLSGDDNHLLMCGNPNRLEGVFFDSHNADRDQYSTHHVDALESKRTNKSNIKMLIRKYGEDSDVVRIRVHGLFPKSSLESFISLETAEFATDQEMERKYYPERYFKDVRILHIGVDVARYGDDSTIISPRMGTYFFDLKKYTKQSTMETAGQVLLICKEYLKKYESLRRCIVKVDDTGVGGGVTDRLREVIREERLPIKVIPVNNGERANDDYYLNLGAELWGNLKQTLEENLSQGIRGGKALIRLPDDDELIKQLSVRKYKITSKGKIQLESKEDMKKRNVGSPDKADAVTLAFYEGSGWLL